MGKGSNGERELRRIAWYGYKYAPVRAAGSGGGSMIPAPDVAVMKNGRILGVESKANPDGTAQFQRREIALLEYWADCAGGEAWVCVKPDLRSHSQWYFKRTRDLHETPSGNFSIRQADHADCLSISDVFG